MNLILLIIADKDIIGILSMANEENIYNLEVKSYHLSSGGTFQFEISLSTSFSKSISNTDNLRLQRFLLQPCNPVFIL